MCACVCVCVKRERVCVCEREREWEVVYVSLCEPLSLSVCVCVNGAARASYVLVCQVYNTLYRTVYLNVAPLCASVRYSLCFLHVYRQPSTGVGSSREWPDCAQGIAGHVATDFVRRVVA